MEADSQLVTPAEILAESVWLRRLAQSLVRGSVSAEDLVQDTYVLALESPPRRSGSIRAWLRTVIKNTSSMRMRAEQRRVAREQRGGNEDAPLPTTEELLAQHQARRIVAEAVAALDEPYRTTVLLCYGEGLAPSEVARRQGILPGTVRWRLKRALTLLRERLDERHGGDRRAWTVMLARLGRPRRTPWPRPLPAAPIGVATASVLVAAAIVFHAHREVSDANGGAAPGFHSAGSPGRNASLPRLLAVAPQSTSAAGLIRGTVTDASGKVVKGATVAAFRRRSARDYSEAQRHGTQVMEPVATALTDGAGRYRLSELAGGTYGITAMAPSFEPGHRGDLVVSAREPIVADLVLAPGGVLVRGLVRDAGGGPIAGARIVATGEVPRSPAFDSTRMFVTTSGSEGRYELSVAPAFTLITVVADGYGTAVAALDLRAGTDRPQNFSLNQILHVEGRAVERGSGRPVPGAELRFVPADGLQGGPPILAGAGADGRFIARGMVAGKYSVTGRGGQLLVHPRRIVDLSASGNLAGLTVEMERGRSIAGLLSDQGGRPVPGAELILQQPDGPPFEEIQAWSDAGGRFLIEAIPDGQYELAAQATGFEPTRAKVEVAGQDVRSLSLVLLGGVAIEGEVRGGDGKPAAGAVVVVWNFAPGKNFPPRRVHAGPDGRFFADQLREGFARVAAEHAALGVGLADKTPLSAGTRPHVRLVLGDGAALSGRVLGPDGKPAMEVNVRSFQGHRAMPFVRAVQTAADGTFSIRRLLPGPVYVVASRSDSPNPPWDEKPSPNLAHLVVVESERRTGIQLVIGN